MVSDLWQGAGLADSCLPVLEGRPARRQKPAVNSTCLQRQKGMSAHWTSRGAQQSVLEAIQGTLRQCAFVAKVFLRKRKESDIPGDLVESKFFPATHATASAPCATRGEESCTSLAGFLLLEQLSLYPDTCGEGVFK